MDIPEESQVKYVSYKLRGVTSSRWDNLQTGRWRQRKQPIYTWRMMKRVIFMRIHEIASRNQLSESDIQQVARFNNGIQYDIQAILSLQTTWTLDEAVLIALKAKQTIKKQGIGTSMYKNKTDTNQSNSSQLGGDAQVDHTKSTHELDGEKRKTTTTTTSTHAVNKSFNNPYARHVGVKCYRC
ncbi:hypothetical protein Tco_0134577 [Tanacetum coccineum]